MPDRADRRTPRANDSFAALRIPSFRNAWLAAIVSNTGGFMQSIAIPVVVFQLTHRTLWLGISTFCGTVSGLFGTVGSGPIVDRVDRRKLILTINFLQAAVAAGLWLAWITDHASLVPLLVGVGAGGLLGGLQSTAWQSVQIDLVPIEVVASAVRLNSTNFAVARATGPALGALVLGAYGAGVCFLLNGLSFLAVVAAFLPVRLQKTHTRTASSPIADFREGWRYLRAFPSLRLVPLVSMQYMWFASVWTPLGAAVSSRHFGHSAKDSGLLLGAYGLGSVLTGLVLGASRLTRSQQVFGAALIASAGLLLTAATHSFVLGLVGFAVLGVGHLANSSGLNTAMQMQADDRFRGRVLAIYMTAIFIAMGTAALMWAKVSEIIGVRSSLLVSSGLLAGTTLLRGLEGLHGLDGNTKLISETDSHNRAKDPVVPVVSGS